MSPRNALTVTVAGARLRLTNLDKVIYPATGLTKAGVIEYYARIAPAMLPHLRGHPVSLKRFPDGVQGEAFFEKNCPAHRPVSVATTPLGGSSGRAVRLCVVEEAPTLVWLANLAALEIHPYLWTANAPGRPSSVVFDLDPGPGATIADCARVGLRLHTVLESLGLECFPKTSGGKGLHITVPLNTRGQTFEATKTFARAVALTLEREDPARITTNMARRLRPGRVFIDWSQNDRHKTTVAPYSLRGRERPTVSTPVAWEEVEGGLKGPATLVFESAEVLTRVERRGDPAAAAATLRQKLPRLG